MRFALVIFGILLIFGCGEAPQEGHFSIGCSEGGGGYGEESYAPNDDDSSGGSASSASWVGTKQIGSSLWEQANGVATDNSNNVFLIGSTAGVVGDSTSKGGRDYVIVKYDISGDRKWIIQHGSSENDFGYDITTDNEGNFYITGSTGGDLDGNGSSDIGGSYGDIFLSKYNNDGNRQWTRQLGTSNHDWSESVVADSNGNIYITGATPGDLDSQASSGMTDIFIIKYNSNGSKQWTRLLGSSVNDYGTDITVDSYGDVYVTGYTGGGIDGFLGAGSWDIILAKYNSSGVKQWVRQLGTSAEDNGYGLVTDSSANVYVTGHTGGGLDGNSNFGAGQVPVTYDLVLIKFDKNGAKQWTKQFGSSGHDLGSKTTIDSSGNFYVTGYTKSSLYGNTNTGQYDLLIIKYDNAGERKWTKQFGSTESDYGVDMAVDANGNLFITGQTHGELDGNTNAGDGDIFLIKYDSSGNKH